MLLRLQMNHSSPSLVPGSAQQTSCTFSPVLREADAVMFISQKSEVSFYSIECSQIRAHPSHHDPNFEKILHVSEAQFLSPLNTGFNCHLSQVVEMEVQSINKAMLSCKSPLSFSSLGPCHLYSVSNTL